MIKTIMIVLLGCVISVPVFAFTTFKYRCVRCNLIQEYQTPGIKRCPNDQTTMIRISP